MNLFCICTSRWVYATEIAGQMRFYASKDDDIPESVRIVEEDKRLEIHVWVAFCQQLGFFKPVLFLHEKTNKNVSVNAETYMDMCIYPLADQIRAAGWETHNLVLQQDGAPCHQANAVQAKVRKSFR